jgi:hypothetical protein
MIEASVIAVPWVAPSRSSELLQAGLARLRHRVSAKRPFEARLVTSRR